MKAIFYLIKVTFPCPYKTISRTNVHRLITDIELPIHFIVEYFVFITKVLLYDKYISATLG